MVTELNLEMFTGSQFSIQGMPLNLNLTITMSHRRSFYTSENNYKFPLSKIPNNLKNIGAGQTI